VTDIAERPGPDAEALQKPLLRTSTQNTVQQYTFADLLAVLEHDTDYRCDRVSVCWKRPAGSFTPELHSAEDAPRSDQ
jgi:hypothetical protein